tara:strand:- start:950 stop:1099 length:150 start_codon:yes stop_codon:yes gene_type:complete
MTPFEIYYNMVNIYYKLKHALWTQQRQQDADYERIMEFIKDGEGGVINL